MTSVLTIDGKEYTPATIAGKHFGYTKDYLLMLIKDGKIDGQKIRNKWYVHVASAEKHFRSAAEVRAQRRKAISLERKKELTTFSRTQKKHSHHTALVETLAIVVIGLSLGATGYLGTSVQTASVVAAEDAFFLEALAVKLYTFISPQDSVTTIAEQAPYVPSESSESPQVANALTANATTTPSSLVVAPADVFTANDVESIRDSFSDPVTVSTDSENPDTGIITPVFRDGRAGDEYRFLLVPVSVRGESETVSSVPTEESLVTSTGVMPVRQN